MNKKYYIAAAIVAIVGFSAMGSMSVSAQTTVNNKATFVQQLAQKLGIDQSKVQTAMDSIQTDRQAEMKKNMEEKLTKAVADGKLTEAQKQLILKKQAELQTEREKSRETMQEKTHEERKQEMDQKKSELEAWAKENGIDLQDFFMGGKGRGMHMGTHMK